MNIQEFVEAISDDLSDLKKQLKIEARIQTRRQQQIEVTKIVIANRDRGVSAEEIIDNLKRANEEASIKDSDGNYIDLNVDVVGSINIDANRKFLEEWATVNQKIKKDAKDTSKDIPAQ